MDESAEGSGVILPCGGSLTETQIDAMDPKGPPMICSKGCKHDYEQVGLALYASQGLVDEPNIDLSEITLSRRGKVVLAIMLIFAMCVFVKYWMMFNP